MSPYDELRALSGSQGSASYSQRVLADPRNAVEVRRQNHRQNLSWLSTIFAFLPVVGTGIVAKAARVHGNAAAVARIVEGVFLVVLVGVAFWACVVQYQNRRWLMSKIALLQAEDRRLRSREGSPPPSTGMG